MKFGVTSNMTIRKVFWSIISLLSALACAVLISSFLILIVGANPIVAYQAFFQGIFGEADGFSEVMV